MTAATGPTSSRTYHIVGAFDRFNYGDVLFAHLAARSVQEADPNARISFYGTRPIDLRSAGGVQTRALATLFSGAVRAGDVVWVAGGEVLASRWTLMAEHNLPPHVAAVVRRLRRQLGIERIDPLFRRLARVPSRLPWVFDPADFPPGSRPTVVYGSVGGRGAAALVGPVVDWARAALGRAAWISVRDHGSQGALATVLGLPPALSPDPAVLMDGLRDRATLKAVHGRLSARTGIAGLPERYICLQCGINYFTGQEAALTEAVVRLQAATALPVVTFAIGRAAGHEDQTVARPLAARLGARAWLYTAPDDMDVWEIMALIAGASCYAGTSLHGFVTAFTFAVPRVGLSPRVGKIVGFRDAWDLPTMPAGIEFADLPESALRAIAHDSAAMAHQVRVVQDIYRATLHDLWKALAVQSVAA